MQSNNYNHQHVLRVESYGAQATVNENASPVCRISFYYKCCVVGCGISPRRGIVDPIKESILIDYDNADSLPGDWQRLLFESALNELKPERLLNQVINIDDEHITLPEDTSNSFYAIETATASSNILLQQYFLRHGLVLPLSNIHRVMLCTSGWLEEFYFNPIKQLTRQAECINSTLSGPPPPSSLLLLQCSFHCSHCRGTTGPCSCECGCPTVAGSTRCKFVHRGIACSSCNTGIEGKLYRPTNTSGEEFCERCYEDGVHDQTHSFYCFDGFPITSVPNLIPPRVQSEENQRGGPLLDLSLQRYIPTAEAVLIHECKTCEAAAVLPSSRHHDGSTMMLEDFDGEEETTTANTTTRSFSEGQVVRLVGLSTHHTSMNGTEAIVLSVVDTDRVQVQIIAPDCQQEHLTICSVRPENLIQVLSGRGTTVTTTTTPSSTIGVAMSSAFLLE